MLDKKCPVCQSGAYNLGHLGYALNRIRTLKQHAAEHGVHIDEVAEMRAIKERFGGQHENR